jgi:IPT/TIG domain-containing protein
MRLPSGGRQRFRHLRRPLFLAAAALATVVGVSVGVGVGTATRSQTLFPAAAPNAGVAGEGGARSGPANAAQPAAAPIRSLRPVPPRKVRTRRARPTQMFRSTEPENEQGAVPPSLRPTARPTTGLPPVVSDGRGKVAASGGSLLAPLSQTGSFANLLAFSGASFQNTCVTQSDGSCSGADPPDTQMAVGRNQVVEAVNNNLFVFNRGGGQITSYPLTQIFQPPNQTVGLTDPKILFDPTTNRYYLTEMVCQDAGCGANNYTHMGISLAISSDGQSWTIYDYLNDGQNLQDQEKLGFSGDKITFAVNEYNCKCGSGSQYKQENVVIVQKSDAVAGNTIQPWVINDSSNNSNSTFLFDSMPTTPVNASTSDNTQWVVWNWGGSSNNFMGVVKITGTPAGNNIATTITKVNIGNTTAALAPVQPSGTINTSGPVKTNFESAMVQSGDLWTTGTDGCTPQNDNATRDCTRLVQVDVSGGSPTLVSDTDIGTQGTYRYNPSVSKDTDGHVFFGFTISSSSQYATAALDASGLPLPSVLQRIDMISGDRTFTGGRWGDYSGTQQDPQNTHDVWTAQEFGACDTGCSNYGFGGNWDTEIGQFTFRDPHITSISPTQGPTLGGTAVDIFGSEFAQGAAVKFGGTASPNVTWFDSTHIRAVSPAHSAGTVDITTTTGAGTSDTSSADEFTYRKIATTTTYTGPNNEDWNDSVTLSARLTSNLDGTGVSGKTISFSVGAESCNGTTNGSGVASCSVLLLDTPGSGYFAQATFTGDADYEPSGASTPFTVNQEESAVSYTGVTTSHYHDVFTATARLTDPEDGLPIAGKTIAFTLGVGNSCSASTDGNGVASCSITPTQTGTKNLVAAFAGDTYYVSSSDTKSFSITPEETTMSYTGPTVILAGASGATLTATMVEDGANDGDGDGGSPAPSPAETVTLSIGSQSCSATTDGSGHVTCSIGSVTVPLGPQTVGASFAGDAYYQASSDSKTAIVFAFPSSGVFTLGDQTVAGAGSSTVTWWSNSWYLLNNLTGGQAPPPFKGFVSAVTLPTTTPAHVCSGLWTTPGGNSAPPPATVPSYMGTIVATGVTKKGNAINGDYVKIVVVKTDPGYAPGPNNSGTGKIVATFCP